MTSSPPNERAAKTRRQSLRPSLVVGALLLITAGGALWWQHARSSEPSASDAAASGAARGMGPRGPGGPGGPGGQRFGGGSRVQPVMVAAVQRRDIRITVNAIGNIAAANIAVVRTRIDGELQKIHFKEGQTVKAGALLAELDARALRIALAQTEGQLARDQAQLQNARLDLQRFKDLLAKDAIAKQQVDTQEALVRQLQGTVQTDQAQVDNAKLQLSYTRIVAPISGRIGLQQADLGNVVRTSDANGLLSIAQTQPVNVVFAVPDSHLPRLTEALNDKARLKQTQGRSQVALTPSGGLARSDRSGGALKVEAWDRDGLRRLAVGQLGSIDNAIDATTSTVKLKARFANEDEKLFPNQFVNVKLQLATLEDSLAVPTAALLRGAEGNFVYVVGEDKTVAVRKVQAGAGDGEWVSVKGDLQAGDLVVTDGVDRLREGAQVEVIKPPVDTPDDGRRGGGRDGRRKRDGAAPADHKPRRADGDRAFAPPGPDSQGGPRGDFLARLPPEVAEKLKAMSPEERRAFFEQRRAERAKREAAGQ